MTLAECQVCGCTGGSGYLPIYADHLERSYAEPCPACHEAGVLPPPPQWRDEDHDGWLDGCVRVPCYWDPGPLDPRRVLAVVIHRYQRGFWSAGPRYLAGPFEAMRPEFMGKADMRRWHHAGKPERKGWPLVPRAVGVHFSVHKPGWERMVTQQAPYTRLQWHAGMANEWSLGIEHDSGPLEMREPWAPETVAASIGLISSLRPLLPNLVALIAHSAIYPRSRRDPGPLFPWGAYVKLGLQLIETPSEFEQWAKEVGV